MRTALLALVAVALFAQSQPPFPTPAKEAQKDKRKSASKDSPSPEHNDQSGAISSAIDKLTSEVRTWKEKQDTSPKESQTFGDWWLKWGSLVAASVSAAAALITAGLIAVQSGVMHKQRLAMDSQAQYMRKGLRISIAQARISNRSALAAKVSADAAMASAKTTEHALEITERADLAVDGLEFVNLNGRPLSRLAECQVTLRNFGRTRADRVIVKAWMDTTRETTRPTREREPSPLPANDQIILRSSLSFLDEETIQKINSGETDLFFFTDVQYSDIFGKPRTFELLGEYNPHNNSWTILKNTGT